MCIKQKVTFFFSKTQICELITIIASHVSNITTYFYLCKVFFIIFYIFFTFKEISVRKNKIITISNMFFKDTSMIQYPLSRHVLSIIPLIFIFVKSFLSFFT